MSERTTKSKVYATHENVISVGYCNLQNMLYYQKISSHTERRDGWGADVYSIGTNAIVTGYAPFGNVKPGYTMTHKYDLEAEKILHNYNLSYETKLEALWDLIQKFIEEATR